LLGNIAGGDNTSEFEEIPWLIEERKQSYISLCKQLPDFASRMKFNSNPLWQKIYTSESPEKALDEQEESSKKLILDTNNDLLASKLRKLILIQVFRPDRLESAMKSFLCDFIQIANLTQSAPSLESLVIEVEKIKNEEKKIVPILFITTLGSDPSKELEDFANKEIGGSQNYIQIPMGAGDNEKISISLKEAAQKGFWICLKNLHLSVSWLPNLEKEIKNLKEVHPRFKIFLTSESHARFSPILLQISKKIAYETPPGVKKNLERIYQLWQANNPIENRNSNNEVAESNNNINNNSNNKNGSSGLVHKLKYQACFSLAFIHALLQERRTYIPQGWTKFYEFSYSDLKVSSESLVNYLDNCLSEKSLPTIWKNVKGLIVNSYYGGRIDNEFDFEIMKTYIEKIFDLNMLTNNSQKILNVSVFNI